VPLVNSSEEEEKRETGIWTPFDETGLWSLLSAVLKPAIQDRCWWSYPAASLHRKYLEV